VSSRLSLTAAFAGVAAMLSIACSDGSGPRHATGMDGTWLFSQVQLNESGAGRGSCVVGPFRFTIDSTSSGVTVSMATKESLTCDGGQSFGLTVSPSFVWVTIVPPDTQHAVALVFDSSATGEMVLFTWPDMPGDSIGGPLSDQDANITVYGLGTWKAARQ
jgi:hypothetical protein